MEYDEFLNLLAGIAPDTPLGAVVAIRSETDTEVLKKYNKTQTRIWSEWRGKQAEKVTKEAQEAHLKQMEKLFRSIGKRKAGGR